MGLVRLKKLVRIVNHPPTQPETITHAQRARQGRAGQQKGSKNRQLFHLLIISTTVSAIFCCICNSRSSICTTSEQHGPCSTFRDSKHLLTINRS